MTMQLRSYQQRAIEQAREQYRQGSRAICIVAPTGSGKTVIGSSIAVAFKGNVLWIAHRRELVQQAVDTLGNGAWVCTVQSMLVNPDMFKDIGLVVLDECHHYAADEWGAVARIFPDALIIGLTATPERSDGRPLGDLFTSLVVAARYSELIEYGHIVPCEVFAPAERGTTLAMTPAEAITKHAADRQSITFCGTVAEANKIAVQVPQAAAVSAETPAAQRDTLVRSFRAGLLQHLVNVFVFSEGFDAPEASVCILGRGASHASTYLQMVGRVLRPAEGKEHATLVDLCGCVHQHGWPTEDRDYSLGGEAITRGRGDPLWQCPRCGMCYKAPPANRLCPGCRERLPEPKAIRVARQRVERQEYFQSQGGGQRRKAFLALQETARRKGYKPGWAMYRYKARYGEWPC